MRKVVVCIIGCSVLSARMLGPRPLTLPAVLPSFSLLGNGPTVLLLHDADADHLSFAPQLETLASAGWRGVAWDMPGYGRSAPLEPYGFKGLVQRCLLLLDALQCTQAAAVVGHGMGAMLALELALRAPARVRRLVLCAGGPPLDAAAQRHWLEPRWKLLEQGLSMEQLAQHLIAPQTALPTAHAGLQLARHSMGRVCRPVYVRALQALPSFRHEAPVLAGVHQPTLLVGGSDDICTPPEALQALAQVLPDARLALLQGVGRWPQLEDPEGFEGVLLDFLAAPRRTLH